MRAAREKTRLTQGQAAAAWGISHRSLKRWEAGHGLPKGDNLNKLFTVFRSLDMELPSLEISARSTESPKRSSKK